MGTVGMVSECVFPSSKGQRTDKIWARAVAVVCSLQVGRLDRDEGQYLRSDRQILLRGPFVKVAHLQRFDGRKCGRSPQAVRRHRDNKSPVA